MNKFSTKEIDNIQNIILWELLTAKKCIEYAKQETNQLNQNVFLAVGNRHKQNYCIVLDYLDEIIKKQGG